MDGGRIPSSDLAFIGEADEDMAEDVHDALLHLNLPAFALALQGVDTFADGDRPKVIWAGVKKCAELMHMQAKIMAALVQKKFMVDTRKFTPHVTLAHLKHPDAQKLGDFIVAHSLFETAPFQVNSFHLYNSRKTDGGPKYEIITSYPLR